MYRGLLLGMWMMVAGLAPVAGTTPIEAPARLQVEVSGHGPPLLMFPGLGCPGRVWERLAARLARDHQVHVIEIPGFAGNAPLDRDGALLPALEKEIDAYIKAHHLERPILIGHSFGGFLATWLATRAPEHYGRVISLDGVPFFSALFDPAATAASVQPYVEQMRTSTLALDAAAFATQQSYLLATMMQDGERAQRLSQDSARSDRRTFVDAMGELMSTDLRPALDSMRQPMLLIGALGALPDAAARGRGADLYRAQIEGHPNIALRLAEHARHFVQYDDPDWLEAEVLKFLEADAAEGRP